MIKTLSIVVLLITLNACLLPGDGAGMVKGTIADEFEQTYSHCVIDLFLKQDSGFEKLKYYSRRLEIAGNYFEQLFVIEPKLQQYVVEISCDDASEQFRSEPIMLGSEPGFNEPADLGKIILKRKP